MELHAPHKWLFGLSLLIAAFSIVSLFMPMEIISLQGFWVALLAYIVLAIASVMSTSWTDSDVNQ